MLKKLIIISGVTSGGKSQISSQIAKQLNTRIILGDSLQVKLKIIQKQFQINRCTKIGQFQVDGMKKVIIIFYKAYQMHQMVKQVHKGIQLLNSRYKELVVEQIEKQDNPLIEGGCSFYLRYLLESGHTYFTEEQMQEADKKAIELLNNSEKKWQVLQQYCPTYDNSINENDIYRFQKALRYALLTEGKHFQHLPISSDEQIKNKYDVRGYFLFSGQNNLNKKIQHRYQTNYNFFLM